jgi:hypothetical protein
MTLFHATGVATAALLVLGSLLAVLRRGRDPVIGVAIGMAAVALLAVQTQPWYLLWALAPAAATDRPRLHRWLGVGCVILAVLVPPTGDDFVARGFQLTNACAAAALLLAAAYTAALLARRATPHPHPADISQPLPDGAGAIGASSRRGSWHPCAGRRQETDSPTAVSGDRCGADQEGSGAGTASVRAERHLPAAR